MLRNDLFLRYKRKIRKNKHYFDNISMRTGQHKYKESYDNSSINHSDEIICNIVTPRHTFTSTNPGASFRHHKTRFLTHRGFICSANRRCHVEVIPIVQLSSNLLWRKQCIRTMIVVVFVV